MFSSPASQFLSSLLVITFILASAPKIIPQSAPQEKPRPMSPADQRPATQSKEEAEALRLLKESTDLLNQGKFDDAIAASERALQVCESAASPDPLCGAAAKIILANLYIKKRDLARAEPLYLEATELFDKHLGPEQFDAVGSLNNLAETFWSLGDKGRALRMYERALTVQEAKLGPQHQDVAKLLTKLATAYRANGNYVLAEQRYKRALDINEKRYGVDHQEVALSLNRLAGVYRVMGEYELSVEHYKRALVIFEEALGTENTTVATVLDNLGLVYQETNKFELAEQAHKRAVATFEKLLGPDHIDVAIALGNLASVYEKTGDYDQSEQLYQRELAIKEKQLGNAHPSYANTLDNFANLLQRKLEYQRAEQMRKRALEIYMKKLGADSPDVAIGLSNLGLLYLEKGDAQAEKMFHQALSIRVNANGENHPHVAHMLLELAEVYRLKGDYPNAMRNYSAALKVARALASTDDLLISDVLEGVGDVYRRLGDLVPAQQLYSRASEINRKVYGNSSLSLLDKMAGIYFEQGKVAEAERLYQQALESGMKRYGENLFVAPVMSHLAELYHMQGQYERAGKMYEHAMAIVEHTIGSDNPRISDSLFQLFLVEWAQGNTVEATRRLSRAVDMEERQLTRILPTGSESQKALFLINLSPMTAATISFNAVSAPLDPAATRLALTTVLRRKGRVLDAMTDEMGRVRRRLNSQDVALFDQLRLARSRYAVRALNTGGSDLQDRRVELFKLEEQIDSLEAQVRKQSSEPDIGAQLVSIDVIQRVIPAGTALVEIVVFTTYNAKTRSPEGLYGDERYAAYVLQHEGDPAFVDLGDAPRIDRAVTRLRASLRDSKSADTRVASRALDELIMRPIRKHLGEVRTILVSPDGALNLIPFGALVDEHGRYLIENYSITYLTSGRDLLRLQNANLSREPPIRVRRSVIRFD